MDLTLTEKQLGNLYRKLNQYPYIEQYDAIQKYLESGKAPNKKFGNKYKDFKLTNNGETILYTKHNLNLQVIKTEEEKQQILQNLYNDFSTGLGKGIKSFYKIIASKYLGITRKEGEMFLLKQVPYQLTKAIVKPKNPTKKIRTPNKVFNMDLIDLEKFASANKQYRYIMSVIDASSHICWLRKIKHKTALNILEAFKSIIETESTPTPAPAPKPTSRVTTRSTSKTSTKAPTKVTTISTTRPTTRATTRATALSQPQLPVEPQAEPQAEPEAQPNPHCKLLFSDNGTEFKGEFEAYLKEKGIKHETSRTYTPVPLIENLNGKIRKLLADLFTRNKNFQWEQHLKQIEDNLNRYQNLPRVKKQLQQANKEESKNPPAPKFKVGDHVRLCQTAINSSARKEYKEHTQKTIIVKYSVEVFTIGRVFIKRSMGEFYKYSLLSAGNNPVFNSNKGQTIARFSEKDMMLVPDPKEHTGEVLNQEDVNKLNQYD